MDIIFYILVCLLVGYVCLSMWIVTIEALAAMSFGHREASDSQPEQTPKTVVLMPAHNEESEIGHTLEVLARDLPSNCRLLCVAHNCSDATADIARGFGAEVIEVNDAGAGGKPDALKAGLRWLDADPPEVVVIIDADCTVTGGSLRALATQAKCLNRPVMGAYFFAAPEQGRQVAKLSSLAIMLKNVIRPLGLYRLGLPCLLNGSGSAYPFNLIRYAQHGEGSIAEDYQLSVDLLNLGYPTTFVPEARVDGRLPAREGTAQKQRRRWEHGHLYLSFLTAPRLLWAGLIGLDRNRIALGLELLVPPLAYLGLLWLIALIMAIASALILNALPLFMLVASAIAFSAAILVSWLKFAGFDMTFAALAAVPGYIIWKLPIYRDFFISRETRWIKTERD
ncbi:hypothetical protein A1359_19640 [Methylomonas lenta]|uniref:Glycosyl transferase n=1 Tax=Methylomonas lenta TaxID=980561 RepID=A0A177NTB1_9GAMM|nr:glycosyltransferase family 2 protein [Methylomonas lenta]OAI21235.1 hypothetical protein A1359_19640 [Methylomonas lenta]